MREWTPYIRIETGALWSKEPPWRKVLALLRGHWQPGDAITQREGREAYGHFMFGGDEHCGDQLGMLN